MRARIARFLRQRDARCAIGLVAACALAVGYFFIRTFIAPPVPYFSLDFGGARWIEPASPAPVVYFRRDIYLPLAVEQAWLQVGATDSFELYVNGSLVATNEFDSTNTSGLFDLKTLLQVGDNAIGVRVLRTIYPDPARMIARLCVKSAGAPLCEFVSDGTWRAAPDTALVPPDLQWCAASFDAHAWTLAKLATHFDPHVNQVDVDPHVLATPPQGQWLTPPNPAAREQGFVAHFNITDAHRDAWLQVAATGDYEMFVNGKLRALETTGMAVGLGTPSVNGLYAGKGGAAAKSRPTNSLAISAAAINPTDPFVNSPTAVGNAILQSALQAPGAGVGDNDQLVPVLAQTASGMVLQVYYLTPWLQRGENEIIVRIRAARGVTAMLADGFTMQPGGEVRRLTGDGVWRAVTAWVGGRALKTAPAVGAGVYGRPPWGILPQAAAAPLTVPLYDSDWLMRWVAGYLAVFAAVFALSLLSSYLMARLRVISLEEAFLSDALLHTPVLCVALLLWLASYDYRVAANCAFQERFIVGFAGLLLVVRGGYFFPLRGIIGRPWRWPRLVKIALLIGIVAVGASLRFHGLAAISLDHDEVTLIVKARGVARTGIPSSLIGSQQHILTTYELATYFIAACGALLGWGEWAMRLPACLFGTLNIVVLAWGGRKMFDWRVGWFAALIYALMPVDIRWAQNAFYPSQVQFFAMVTIVCFYEAIRTKPFRTNYLCAAAVAFCPTYLSWEGTGFILPVLFLALLAVRWGEFWWLREWRLYQCLFWMSFVVLGQLCIRFLVHDPYLMVGVGLSSVCTPSLFFLDPNFNPYYYLIKLPLSENHVVLTLIICAGIVFSWWNTGIRYLFVVVVASLTCYTALLSAYSPRYSLFYQPIFILLGAAITFFVWDTMSSLTRRIGSPLLYRLNQASMAFFALIVFISTNPWVLKAYRLSAQPEVPGYNVRMGSYRVDYRGAARFVKAHLQPGDVVIPGIPHVYEYYTGNKGGYFLDTLLALEIFYEPAAGDSFYRDKFVGNPVIRNLDELKEVVNRAPRTWVIQAPLQFAELNEPNVLVYLNVRGHLVFESYNANVILIEGAGTSGTPATAGWQEPPGSVPVQRAAGL